MDNDESDRNKKGAGRRGFLAVAASLPAFAAAALLTRKPGAEAAAPPVEADGPPVQSGYHETEHIRKYYSSASF